MRPRQIGIPAEPNEAHSGSHAAGLSAPAGRASPAAQSSVSSADQGPLEIRIALHVWQSRATP
jgi:hypothetical protein